MHCIVYCGPFLLQPSLKDHRSPSAGTDLHCACTSVRLGWASWCWFDRCLASDYCWLVLITADLEHPTSHAVSAIFQLSLKAIMIWPLPKSLRSFQPTCHHPASGLQELTIYQLMYLRQNQNTFLFNLHLVSLQRHCHRQQWWWNSFLKFFGDNIIKQR